MTSVVDVPSNSRENVGGGYDDVQFDFRALEIHDPDGAEGPQGEKLYAVSNNMFLVVDVTTDARSLISKGTDVGNIGAGPINAEAFGDRWTRTPTETSTAPSARSAAAAP